MLQEDLIKLVQTITSINGCSVMLKRLSILNCRIRTIFHTVLLMREVSSSRSLITSESNTQNVKIRSGLKETVHLHMLLLLFLLWLIDTAKSINKRSPSPPNNCLLATRTSLWDAMEDMLPDHSTTLRDRESLIPPVCHLTQFLKN